MCECMMGRMVKAKEEMGVTTVETKIIKEAEAYCVVAAEAKLASSIKATTERRRIPAWEQSTWSPYPRWAGGGVPIRH